MAQHQLQFQKAQKALAAGKFDSAEKTLRKLLKSKDLFVPVRITLSKALVAQNKPVEAAQFLAQAADHQPQQIPLQKAAGDMLTKVGAYDRAIPFLERTVAAEPKNSALWASLLNAMLESFRLSKAEQSVDDLLALSTKAIELFPTDLGLIQTAGEICFAAKLYDPAAKYLEACLGQKPANLSAHHRWLEIHHIMDEHQPILGYADKYQSLVADDPLCNRVIASAYEKDGKAHIALDYIERCLRVSPDNPEYLGTKGRFLYFLGKFDEALPLLEQSIQKDPTLIAATANRCLVNKNLGRIADAARDEPFRLKVPDGNPKFHLNVPYWEGELLDGKRLFIWSDQGVGDVFKYAPMIHEINAGPEQIILCVQAKLVTFLQHVFPAIDVRPFPRYYTPPLPEGEIRISPRFEEIDEDFDCHVPIGYLYRFFRPDIPSFTSRNRPFSLTLDLVEGYRTLDILSDPSTTKVGLAWSSKNKSPISERNYLDLEQLLPILQLPGFEFFNFQYDVSEAEIDAFRQTHNVPIYHAPGLDLFDDLLGTAAFNNCMDLFFSPASTCSDIAGSMGIKSLRADLVHMPENLGQSYVPWYKDQKSISIPYEKSLMDFFPDIIEWLEQNKLHRNPLNQ